MIDQGRRAKIMYPDLYKGLGLKLDDLSKYDVPLVGFDGNTIIPKGMIRLPMQMGRKVVNVDFIVMEAYSPNIAILARLHTMGGCIFNFACKVEVS